MCDLEDATISVNFPNDSMHELLTDHDGARDPYGSMVSPSYSLPISDSFTMRQHNAISSLLLHIPLVGLFKWVTGKRYIPVALVFKSNHAEEYGHWKVDGDLGVRIEDKRGVRFVPIFCDRDQTQTQRQALNYLVATLASEVRAAETKYSIE